MLKTKKVCCLLLSVLTVVLSMSATFCAAAAEDAGVTAAEPLSVQIEMSKSSYFVTAKARATLIVRNTGSETLKSVTVSAFSEKHLLPAGNESCLIIPELPAGQSAEYSFALVLNRKNAGVSFIERVLLFFAQLFRAYKPMQGIPSLDGSSLQEVTFRHGSAKAVLKVNAWYQTVSTDEPENPPRPQVTYLEKYVVDILQSGEYTVRMETNDGDMPVQVTMYFKDDDRAMEMPLGGMMLQNLGLPASLGNIGKVRVIVKDIDANPKGYVVFPAGYIEMEDIQDAADMIKEAGGGDIRQIMQIDRLQYCCNSFGVGYVCETYLLPEENLQYNFYFTQTADYNGLVRWDVVDLNTKEVSAKMVMRLYDKVTDSSAFTVSGRKMDPSELEGLFS